MKTFFQGVQLLGTSATYLDGVTVPFNLDLSTWHKTITDTTFAESIESLPAKFLPRVAFFNGVDDKWYKYNFNLNNGRNPITLIIRFNSNDIAKSQGLLGDDTSSNSVTRILSSKLAIRVGGINHSVTDTLIVNTVYEFALIRKDSTQWDVYKDGIFVSTETLADADFVMARINIGNFDSSHFFSGEILRASIYLRELTTSEVLLHANNGMVTNPLFDYVLQGYASYEYDLSGNNNNLIPLGTGDKYSYSLNEFTHLNNNGYSLWEHATSDPIQVPFDIDGNALSLTPGTDIPTGYTKTRDIGGGGAKWNMADSKVDFENGNILQCDTAGVAYISSSDAYGEWEFEVLKTIDSNSLYTYIIAKENAKWNDGTNEVYMFGVLASGVLRLIIASAPSTLNYLFATDTGYVSLNTKYTIKITRSEIGSFSVSIKGGSFGNSYVLVDVSGGSGSNPIINNSYTVSNYHISDNDSTDQISNIQINDRPISPYEFTVLTGAYSIIDTPALVIFNRSNATIQTSASRAADYYDATHPYQYHISEIADPRVYDTYFEAAYKDLVFGKVDLDGTDLIRYDEQLNYGTVKTGADLVTVEEYCGIDSIYP